MQTDSFLKEALASITAHFAEAVEVARREGYARGQRDANEKIRALLAQDILPQSQELSNAADQAPLYGVPTVQERMRAPKGLPKDFVCRAVTKLAQRADVTPGLKRGASLTNILALAETSEEKMIAPSTIRGELRKGRKDGLYEEHNGLWFLAKNRD